MRRMGKEENYRENEGGIGEGKNGMEVNAYYHLTSIVTTIAETPMNKGVQRFMEVW